MFRVNPRATLGRIIFTILIQKFEKQWKILRVFWKHLPLGPPYGIFFQTQMRIFHCLYQYV